MSLAKSSLMFSAGTFLSRISGVLRESVVGAIFGASAAMDAFVVAYRIPNLLRDLLAEGALGSSFTKVYTDVRERDAEKARQLFLQTIYLVGILTTIIATLGIFFSPDLVRLITEFDDKSGTTFDLTVNLTQLMFPYIAMASLGSIVMGALYQKGGFFLSAVSPIAFNLAQIFGAVVFGKLLQNYGPVWLTEKFGDPQIFGLALGVLLGGILQFLMQLWGLWKSLLRGKSLAVKIFPISRDFVKIIFLMAPMVISTSAAQFNAIINTNFATQLPTGSVSWLNYAFRILQLPVGMFGVAVGAVALPSLVKSITAAGRKVDAISSQRLFDAAFLVLWLTVPCLIIMHAGAQPIIALLYKAGEFNEVDLMQTAAALQAYSYAVMGYGLIKVFTSFFYAIEKTFYAMMVSIICVAINYAGNAILVKQFGHTGLAMTASVTLTLNACLLLAGSMWFGAKIEKGKTFKFIASLTIATILASALQNFPVGLPTSGILKIDALIEITLRSVLVLLAFIGPACSFYQTSPRRLLRIKKNNR